ncbi:mitochondrial carrier domain-containing protein [Umbelopsis sp. AD052]|nr:mitochondrial carrier domain-containing protein [Umbelopsis sp. AD052]
MSAESIAVIAPPKQTSAAADFIAGNMGGMCQVLVGQPLDTIKVRLQLDSGRFNGAMDCAVQTIKNEGFFALYKGMASPLVGIGAVNALLFAANTECRRLLQSYPGEQLPLYKIAIAGSGAGIVNSVLASPVEMLKIKLQAQFGKGASGSGQRYYSGPIDCAQDLIRQHGVANGLFRGLWATVVREIPAYAGFYVGFEATKRTLVKEGHEASVLQLMTAGAAGGLGYWAACYPLDVVKSKVQNQVEPPRGFYIMSTLKTIHAESGFAGLFRGFGPSLVRAIPAAGATFTAYELTMRAIEKNNLI